jgi:hypothetical protein
MAPGFSDWRIQAGLNPTSALRRIVYQGLQAGTSAATASVNTLPDDIHVGSRTSAEESDAAGGASLSGIPASGGTPIYPCEPSFPLAFFRADY